MNYLARHPAVALAVLLTGCYPSATGGGPSFADTGSGSAANAGSGSRASAGSGCVQAANFPALARHADNAAYPAPSVSASCSGTELVVKSNGIPAYAYQQVTPNALKSQNHEFRLPLSPRVAAATTKIPLLGTAGVAVNGMPIYGPNEGPHPDPYGDPIYNSILDWCKGHTGFSGDYHYHALFASCLTKSAGSSSKASPVLGYAADGFPIYGPFGCVDSGCANIVEFKSGWDKTGDPKTYAWNNYKFNKKSGAAYLDECNGRTGPDGTYRYHATDGFPYIIGCYRGTPSASSGSGAPGGSGGGPPQRP